MAETQRISPIRSCGSGKPLGGYVGLQINDEYSVLNNHIYYEAIDFDTVERKTTTKADTEDLIKTGSPRKGTEVTTFQQEMGITLKEDITARFLQHLYLIQIQNDNYKKDFMNCGINVYYVTIFPDGTIVQETYIGSSVTEMDDVFKQLASGETEIALTIIHNNEPTIINTGLSIPLLEDETEPTATVTETLTAGKLVLDITNIIDPDMLIFPVVPTTDQMLTELFKIEDKFRVPVASKTGTTAVTFDNLPAGDYEYVVSWLQFIDSSNMMYYNSMLVKKITVTSTKSGKVTTEDDK